MFKFTLRVGLRGSVCVDLIPNRFTDPWGTGSVHPCILLGVSGYLCLQGHRGKGCIGPLCRAGCRLDPTESTWSVLGTIFTTKRGLGPSSLEDIRDIRQFVPSREAEVVVPLRTPLGE